MILLGLDIGSRNVKLVICEHDVIIHSAIYDTAFFYRQYCSNENGQLKIQTKMFYEKEISRIAATGYGRNNVNVTGAVIINELKAHMYGAIKQTGLRSFTLLDIGGQDSKVIVVEDGNMKDMILNDKCAASCGRYLENMSNVLGIEIDELSRYTENPEKIDSTCAVFGESELIGKISHGKSIKALAAGVNYSLYKRIEPMIKRFSSECLVITGGVAENKALVYFIKRDLGFKTVIAPDMPQLNGAIGCVSYLLQHEN